MPNADARIALVHDYLNQYGGAERVVERFHALYPHAPVFTSIFAPDQMPTAYRSWDIRTTFMQHIPRVGRHHQAFLPLYPFAFGLLRLDAYDLVLSCSSAFAKGVRVPDGTVHVCYCNSPMRFAWDLERYAEREQLSPLVTRLLPPVMARLRNWDVATSRRIDAIIANSTVVARRIRTYWGRESTVIFPPVDTDAARPVAPDAVEDYYLVVSRLVPYKRFDLVIDAFNLLGLPLKIVGDGRARVDLERRAGPTIQFLGTVSDEEKYRLYARCRAAIFPAEDDFGIAQLEVQASGRPAIAYGAGGALDTVIDGETGILFSPQSVDAIVAAVRRFEQLTFQPERIIQHARRFSHARFDREIRAFVDGMLDARRGKAGAHPAPERLQEATTWS